MKIENKIAIWNGLEGDLDLSDFFNNLFHELNKEIEICITKFSLKKPHEIFYLCTEMSWLGLVNSSITRLYGNDVSTLREVSLYDTEGKFSGRPDLLVSVKINNHDYFLLMEGKIDEFKGLLKETDADMRSYYSQIRNKAFEKYETHFQSKTNISKLIIVPIIFEWMRSQKAVSKASSFFNDYKSDLETQFCSLHTLDDHGMWVYGRIYDK